MKSKQTKSVMPAPRLWPANGSGVHDVESWNALKFLSVEGGGGVACGKAGGGASWGVED